jgi:hypothetical protein
MNIRSFVNESKSPEQQKDLEKIEQNEQQQQQREEDDQKVFGLSLNPSRLKDLIRQYGMVAISLEVGISLICTSIIYLELRSGVDVLDLFRRIGLEDWFPKSPEKFQTGATLLLALAINKALFPFRAVFTLALTPPVARWWGYRKQKNLKNSTNPSSANKNN